MPPLPRKYWRYRTRAVTRRQFTQGLLSSAVASALRPAWGRNPRGSATGSGGGGGGATPIFNFTTFGTGSQAGLSFSTASPGNGADLFPGGGIMAIIPGNPLDTHTGTGMWYSNAQIDCTEFTADFTFQQTLGGTGSPNGAFTFCIQNSTATTQSIVGHVNGHGIGLQGDANCGGLGAIASLGISSGNQFPGLNSVALCFSFYTSDNSEVEYSGTTPCFVGLLVNGGPDGTTMQPLLDPTVAGISFGSGHTFACHVVYDGTLLTMTLKDTVTGAALRHSWPINIPACCQQNTAWVGFTSGSVANPAPPSLNILNWSHSQGFNSRLAAPTFSVSAGQYTTTQTVAISGSAGAAIWYTTNGLQPVAGGAGSTLYAGPLTISTDAIVQAIAVQSGRTDSLVALANYQIRVSATPTINFPTSLAGSSGLLLPAGWTRLSGTSYQLTNNDATFYKSGALWYAAPVAVTGSWSAIATLNFSSSSANGMALVLQNQNPSASTGYISAQPGSAPGAGYGTGQLSVTGGPLAIGRAQAGFGFKAIQTPNTNQWGNGYYGLYSSFGVLLNAVTASIEIYQNGAFSPIANAAITGLTLGSGHDIQVTLSYSGTTLIVAVKDLTTSVTSSHTFTGIDIPGAVSGSTAYFGVTASTNGGQFANQFVKTLAGF